MYKSKRRPDLKDVANASLIPTYSNFKSRHGAFEAILEVEILAVFSLK